MALQMKDNGVLEPDWFADLFQKYRDGYWMELNFGEMEDRAGGQEKLITWLIWNGIRFIYLPMTFKSKKKETVIADGLATIGMSNNRIIVGKGLKMIPG